MRKMQSPISLSAAVTVPHLPQRISLPTGVATIDVDLDAELDLTSSRFEMQRRRYRLPEALHELAPYVLRNSSEGRAPFNGANVRLDVDIDRSAISAGESFSVRRGSFFTSLASNELTRWSLEEKSDPWDFRGRFLFEQDGTVQPLSRSQLGNGIGVSTLAITADDYLILVLQSKANQTSSGLWAPSGSGAMEPRDFGGQRNPLLRTAVLAGAERELNEESRIGSDQVLGGSVIGYSRWLDRGAKPEFYCVTALHTHSRDVRQGTHTHPWWSAERNWTSDVTIQHLSLERAARAKLKTTSAPLWRQAGLVTAPERLEESISLPLSLALDALTRSMRRNPGFMDDLRRSSADTKAAR